MGNVIRLMGAPSIEVDGAPGTGPRGRKAWALLAVLALAERPPSRQRLAGLLFAEANDPMAALRWSLAELRRALGGIATVEGDPVRLTLTPATTVDAGSPDVGAERWLDAAEPPGELLAGMSFARCDAFDAWLAVERRRLAAAIDAIVHETALRRLAASRPREAARLAACLVERNPYDENHHVLLVRALATAGDRQAAHDAVRRARTLFRRELGTDPSPALADAATARAGAPSVPPSLGVAAAQAQLDAGRAAIAAGAVDAGIECLRRAVEELRFRPADALQVAALCELGSALVHSVRGRDEEGAALLHEVVERAAHIDAGLAARACRELGFIDVQAGRRERASRWLAAAKEHAAAAAAADAELAAVLGVEGMNLSDQARYPEAIDALGESIERAERAGNLRQAAWSASILGRLHVLRADHDRARVELDRSLEWVRAERWLAFRPWPEAFVAELDRLEGRRDVAGKQLRQAFALSCQLGDPCWEGVTARGLGLLDAVHDPERAVVTLLDASIRCVRWPDAYQWVHGYVLDALCGVAADIDPHQAEASAHTLLQLASRTDMRELLCRAQRHLARIGAPGAAEVAELVASSIDNPALVPARV